MGKNVGDDLREGKPTLPLIFTLSQGNERQSELVRSAINERSTEHQDEIIAAVSSNGSLDYARKIAARYANQARDALAHMPNNQYSEALLELVNMATTRRR